MNLCIYNQSYAYLIHISCFIISGVPSRDLSEILPTALITGHGEKVCTFLLALCSCALVVTQHTWQPFRYTYFSMKQSRTTQSSTMKTGGSSGNNGDHHEGIGGGRQYVLTEQQEEDTIEVAEEGNMVDEDVGYGRDTSPDGKQIVLL